MSHRQIAAPMDPSEFVRKWGPRGSASKLNERAGAQAHFIDLCRMLAVPEPSDPETYCFERSFHRTNRTLGFADVWKRGCFAWEYKAPNASLHAALDQLMQYAMPLENPPLLIVSDRKRFEIHTHFTGYASSCIALEHEDLKQPEARSTLRTIFSDPYSFRPGRTSIEITQEAARGFAAIAERMQARGIAPHRAAHFLTQCLFCMFAQNAGLLKTDLFRSLTENKQDAVGLRRGLTGLFTVMRTGGDFGVEDIPWFNGGLFEVVDVPALTSEDVGALRGAAALDWRGLDPSIFGTLFERGLDPRQRKQLGAHYTDPDTIAKLVVPVVEQPLLAVWSQVKVEIANLLGQRDSLRGLAERIPSTSKREQGKYKRTRTTAKSSERQAQDLFNKYLERLRDFRILDPACGSGNFLYVALRALKDIEHRVNLEAEGLGLHRQLPLTGPQNVLGLELNAYAAELSRVTIWIGELQWRMQHGFGWKEDPILDQLNQIECRDALMNADGSEALWPRADVAVGNPPFVGNKKMRGELGDLYFERLTTTYAGAVPGGADLVCYWFSKAWRAIQSGELKDAGLVATNSIRGGVNRTVLEPMAAQGAIHTAWSDESWVNEGAAVRVSLIGFGGVIPPNGTLDGAVVARISAGLSDTGIAGNLDLSSAVKLTTNRGSCFMGVTKVGSFDIPGEMAREWLLAPNPHGRSSSEVLRPSFNGIDITRRPRDGWIVDFGVSMTEPEAALFEKPFSYVDAVVKPERSSNNRDAYRILWWRHGESRPGLRALLAPLSRYIATPEVAKHRVFAFVDAAVLPDKNLQVVPRADDTTFGLLHSRMHEVWSLGLCTWMGKGNDPRYTPTTCFETFPFPIGLTPPDTAAQRTEALPDGTVIPADLPAVVRPHAEAVARAAKTLNDLREGWLNPPEWITRVPEVVPMRLRGSMYPERVVALRGWESELAKRTLTSLYNARPAWLSQAHQKLDSAVAAAYGWTDYSPAMTDEEVLRRLLAENLQRAARQRGTQIEMPLLNVVGGRRESSSAATASCVTKSAAPKRSMRSKPTSSKNASRKRQA